jgi:hypothetical protein
MGRPALDAGMPSLRRTQASGYALRNGSDGGAYHALGVECLAATSLQRASQASSWFAAFFFLMGSCLHRRLRLVYFTNQECKLASCKPTGQLSRLSTAILHCKCRQMKDFLSVLSYLKTPRTVSPAPTATGCGAILNDDPPDLVLPEYRHGLDAQHRSHS